MDAVADSQIPQTTAVKRDQQFQVTYDGEPRFKSIEGTPLAFAVNTPTSVIRDAGRYWACDQAVWYVAPTPSGPWTVSDRRPPDIDQVPPSAPVYNTRYVYVYQSTPEVVYVGYLPGYTGHVPVLRHRGLRHRLLLSAVHRTHGVLPPPRNLRLQRGLQPLGRLRLRIRLRFALLLLGHALRPVLRPGMVGPAGLPPLPAPLPRRLVPPSPGYRPPYPGRYRPPARGSAAPGGSSGGARPPRPATAGGWNNNIYARPENRARNVDRPRPSSTGPRPAPPTGPTTSTPTGRATCTGRTRAAPGTATRRRGGSRSR